MMTPNRWTMILGAGLVYAVPTLVGFGIWLIHPEMPNFSFPLFGAFYGLPLMVLVLYLWIRALRKAENESHEVRLHIGAALFVVATLGTAFLTARGILTFHDSSAAPGLVAQPEDHESDLLDEAPMSESERQLHSRAVHSVEDGAVAWMEKLAASDAHGPAGSMPGFLTIEPLAASVRVSNRGTERIRLAIARHLEAATEHGYCPYRSKRGPEFYEISAGGSEEFVPAPACATPEGEFEVRVGNPVFQDAVAWWSDTAIARWQAANRGTPIER